MRVFLIECGYGSHIINGLGMPLLFGSAEMAQAYIDSYLGKSQVELLGRELRVVEGHFRDAV